MTAKLTERLGGHANGLRTIDSARHNEGMSATRLLVLGVIQIRGRTHGYQVRRELVSWSADQWANIKPGSLYHALKQLTKERLLEAVEVEESEAGPERTMYEITEDGRTELSTLVSRGLSQAGHDQALFTAAFSFLPVLPRKQAVVLLKTRMTELRAELAKSDLLVEANEAIPKPAHVHQMFRLWSYTTEAMVRWIEETVARLEAGDFVMADDSPEHFGASPRPSQ